MKKSQEIAALWRRYQALSTSLDILNKGQFSMQLAGPGSVAELVVDQNHPAMLQLNQDMGDAFIKARQAILKELKHEIARL